MEDALRLPRRSFLSGSALAVSRASSCGILPLAGLHGLPRRGVIRAAQSSGIATWIEPWRRNILGTLKARYCDTAMGEEVGWLIAPVLEALYFGYRATGD